MFLYTSATLYLCLNVNSPLQPPAEDTLDSPSSPPPSSSQLPAKARDGTPPSPHWRRSPSYEKLQEMVFSSSPTSSLSRPNPRRSHTLSLSGSDVFREDSKYGELLGEAVVVRLLVEYCRRGEGGRRRRREERKEGGGGKREEGKKRGG